MNEETTTRILAMLQADAIKQTKWKVTYRQQMGKRQILGYKIILAETKDEAYKRADLWRPLIISIDLL